MQRVTLVISITQQHLDIGQSKSFLYCPVAEAMKAVFSDALFGIWDDKIEFSSGYQLILPAMVISKIKAIDRKQQVMPFSFELEIDLEKFKPETQQNIMKYSSQKRIKKVA